MSGKRESVAGCIRRLRNKLKAAGNGMVTIGYADLMVSLDAIETAHKSMCSDYEEMVERCEEIKSKYCLARNRIDKVTSLHPDATYEMILSKIKEFDYILKGEINERK